MTENTPETITETETDEAAPAVIDEACRLNAAEIAKTLPLPGADYGFRVNDEVRILGDKTEAIWILSVGPVVTLGKDTPQDVLIPRPGLSFSITQYAVDDPITIDNPLPGVVHASVPWGTLDDAVVNTDAKLADPKLPEPDTPDAYEVVPNTIRRYFFERDLWTAFDNAERTAVELWETPPEGWSLPLSEVLDAEIEAAAYELAKSKGFHEDWTDQIAEEMKRAAVEHRRLGGYAEITKPKTVVLREFSAPDAADEIAAARNVAADEGLTIHYVIRSRTGDATLGKTIGLVTSKEVVLGDRREYHVFYLSGERVDSDHLAGMGE
jgi:hypothetical protein